MDGIEQMFFEIPAVTRTWVLLSVLTTAACFFELVSPLQLYLSYKMIYRGQVWRLLSPFLFFGTQFNLEFFFQMFFLMRYCATLEKESFRNRTADFFWFTFVSACLMLIVAPFFKFNFLGSSLNFTMVYLWARRNPYARMNLLGLFEFRAPYLPYVLMGFSMLLGSSGATDLMGIAIGHIYYFLEDIYPLMIPSRTRLLKTPSFVKSLFGGAAGQPFVVVADAAAPAAVGGDAPAADDDGGGENDDDDDDSGDDSDGDNNHAHDGDGGDSGDDELAVERRNDARAGNHDLRRRRVRID